jgi:P27 family predicted phage terminase small subunit
LINEVRPPSWLTKRQRQLWREILADAPYGLLRRIDRQLLVNYVELAERHERAAIALQKLDEVAGATPLLSGSGAAMTVSPYVQIMDRCVLLMTRLQGQMGFTPSARATLGVPLSPAPRSPSSPHELFDTILPDGTRVPYGGSRQ